MSQLLIFPTQHRFKIRRQIHDRRREILDSKLKLRQMCRVFESEEEKARRLELEQLRRTDLAEKSFLINQRVQ